MDEHEAVIGNEDAGNVWCSRCNAMGFDQRFGRAFQYAARIVDEQDDPAACRTDDEKVVSSDDRTCRRREAVPQVEYRQHVAGHVGCATNHGGSSGQGGYFRGSNYPFDRAQGQGIPPFVHSEQYPVRYLRLCRRPVFLPSS